MDKPLILIIDDGKDILDYCNQFLVDGFDFAWEQNGKDGILKLKDSNVAAVLLDKNFKDAPDDKLLGSPDDILNEGFYILEHLKKEFSQVPVIMVTSYGDLESARRALLSGADDYIEWGALGEDKLFLKHRIEKTIQGGDGRDLIKVYNAMGIIGKSEKILQVYKEIENAARSDATVLILGETGAGKELVARAIHKQSKKAIGPFIKMSCVNIPETLFESELFGYEKGAFTGAISAKPGRFELANNGSMFLDEIAEIPLSIQPKFLRVLDEKSFERLGSKETIQVDVRIISATNRELKEEVDNKRFREDLFWRLKVLTITVPPLRERHEDIPLLVEHFIEKYSVEYGFDISGISKEALKYLRDCSFERGNVRELENLIASSLHYADRVITFKDILQASKERPKEVVKPICEFFKDEACTLYKDARLKNMEKRLILERLKMFNGNAAKTAESLGIGKTTLYEKIREYGFKGKKPI